MPENDDIERFYDGNGRLRGEKPKNGTGVVRSFNENGNLNKEYWIQNGKPTGYVKMFDTDGTFLMLKFWHNLRFLSKKRYQALCEKDSTLPRFDDIQEFNFLAEDLKKERRRQREEAMKIREKDNTQERIKNEQFCKELLGRGRNQEVMAWLLEKSKGVITLGELQTNSQSIELARKLYRLGAEEVIAVEIGSDEHGESASKLVIRLPSDPEKRRRLFRWSTKNARSLGFDPDVDIGQVHLFVMLD